MSMASTAPMISRYQAASAKLETIADFFNDQGILNCLPEGSVVIKVTSWRAAGWTQTTCVEARLSDGSGKEYFMKTCSADFGALMMEGEFQPLKACMLISLPRALRPSDDPEAISMITADLHRRSAGEADKFGFPMPNCHAKIVQPNSWDSDWSRYFTVLMTAFYKADVGVNGTEAEYGRLFELLKQHVIPRLLKPLQADGRVLQPCLVHGDLWHENIGINDETDEPMVYDASAFYGHNEYEVGTWRSVFVAFDERYRERYRHHYPPSEPAEEWEDRNRLYSMPFNITHSAGWLGAAEVT